MTTIRVWAADEARRKLLRHPTGAAFANHPAGTEWPEDQFTYRRINDGDIVTTDPAAAASPPPVNPPPKQA
jgi:hypothetical protein